MKKNVNKFHFIIPFIILLFTIWINDAIADCNPLECEEEWIHTERIVELPGFSGCSVTFGYRYRTCEYEGDKVLEISVYSFMYDTYDEDCEDLDDYLAPGGEPDWGRIDWAFREGFEQICIAIFIEHYTSAPPERKWEFECDEIETTYQGVWASCGQIVVYSGGGTHPKIEVVIDPCDDLICCLQKLDICWDTVEEQLVIDEDWDYYEGECEDDPEEHPGSLFESDCYEWCIEE